MMRILFCTILLATMIPRWSHAEELISGVLAFDPPPFLSMSTLIHGGTNSESDSRIVRRYAATDNDPRTSQRLVMISVRETGTAADSGKAGNDRQPDTQTLRTEMQAAINSTRNATNVAPVTDAEVGGQTALLASYQMPRPYWQKPDGVLFPSEVYWVKVSTNQVVEIRLTADSMEHLQTLKACLPKFKIANTAAPPVMQSTVVTP